MVLSILFQLDRRHSTMRSRIIVISRILALVLSYAVILPKPTLGYLSSQNHHHNAIFNYRLPTIGKIQKHGSWRSVKPLNAKGKTKTSKKSTKSTEEEVAVAKPTEKSTKKSRKKSTPKQKQKQTSIIEVVSETNSSNNDTNNTSSSSNITVDWTDLEQRVVSSAQADLDLQRLVQALQARTVDSNDLLLENEATNAYKTAASPWKIAIAAASVSSLASLLLFHNFYLSLIVLVGVFIAASRDPLDEATDDVTGALARTVGRVTVDSIEASQPKVRALARAVITGEEEILELQMQIQRLEKEKLELEAWKERKIKIDSVANDYKIGDLKNLLKDNDLSVSGTKSEMLMRLVEQNIIQL